jgi:hypothetical protein
MGRVSAFGTSAALHVFALIWLVGRSALAATPPPAATADTNEPTVMLVESLPPSALPSETGDAPDPLGIQVDTESASVALPGFTFDFAKVANRASVLFPFVSGSVSLQRLTAPARSQSRSRLPNPLAQPAPDEHKPPLVLDDAALQAAVDKSWSRRDRWRVFRTIAALATTHNPSEGRLPELLGAYVAQNGLQPYIDAATRDPRLWVELGLAADHTDFIDFVMRFASTNPSTKAATELMFLVEKLAQGSLDALTTLVDTDPGEELRWTRRANDDAYKAIVRIRDHYRLVLARKGLTSGHALKAHYDGVRLAVLESILLTTPDGYRAGDARFLMGAIYWRQGRVATARRVWKDIRVDPDDHYAVASTEIEAAMRAAEERGVDQRRINRILEYEQGRWVSFSFDRLWEFGYRFDTF